jgi:hypothetical protein
MGVPSVVFTAEGVDQKMYVDTGAKLSYVDEKIAANYSPIGKEKDFYPGIGEFKTLVYDIPMHLGKFDIQIHCGVLPAVLATAVRVSGNSGIIGAELYEKFVVCLAFPEDALYLENIR